MSPVRGRLNAPARDDSTPLTGPGHGGVHRPAGSRVGSAPAGLENAEDVDLTDSDPQEGCARRGLDSGRQRFVIARESVADVLAEPRGGGEISPAAVVDGRPARVAAAVPGSVVPQWREGLTPAVLAPGYRRLMGTLAVRDGDAMDCRQLEAALGLEPVPARVEGVRAKRSAWRRGAGCWRIVRGCSAWLSGESAVAREAA